MIVLAGLAIAGAAAPQPAMSFPITSAKADPAATARAPAPASAERPVVVTGRPHRHRVMRFLFGRHRRTGGFFANLFHRRRHRLSLRDHNRACQQHFRSFNARTNSYRAYSGVRRICLY